VDIPDPPEPILRKACKRYDIPGHAHELTFSCFRRQPFLNRDRTRGWMIDAIALPRKRPFVPARLAWVIMPEHVHLLIYPREPDYQMSRILSTLKQPVSKRAVLFVRNEARAFIPKMMDRQPNGKESLRFWQRGGGYDLNLWTPAKVWEKIDYLHANAVRRGLVGRPEDWEWSSYADYAGIRNGPLPIDRESLPGVIE
jgi:putative transposase